MIGDILLTLAIIVAVLVGLVLVMPVTFQVRGSADDDAGLAWQARVAWGWCLVAVRADQDGLGLRLLGIPVWRFTGKTKDAAKRRKRGRTRREKPAKVRDDRGRGLVWFLSRRHLIVTILGRYLRALHVRGEVDGVVGMAHADDTARLYQILAAIDAVLPEGVLAVEVDWVEEVVQLEAKVSGWVWPLQVVAITAWVFLDRTTWRALRADSEVRS